MEENKRQSTKEYFLGNYKQFITEGEKIAWAKKDLENARLQIEVLEEIVKELEDEMFKDIMTLEGI